MMKLLLIGNHTCGNRGDGAILRGLIQSLTEILPNIEIDILSRYPISSTYLLGRKTQQDELFLFINRTAPRLRDKILKKIGTFLQPLSLIAHIENKGLMRYFPLPDVFIERIHKLQQYDAVIQVGGSFFVDLYGINQFEHSLCAILAKKPIYMIGHSVGPFERKKFNKVANYVFSKVNSLVLREKVSFDLMQISQIDTSKVKQGTDTAWLVNAFNINASENYILLHWRDLIKRRKTIAITMRELSPFDRRLKITQKQYEQAFVRLIDELNDRDYDVLAVSTCTGIESYHRDDRMIALSIKDQLKRKDRYNVVIDEINDVELGYLLSLCTLTIGTRLHSTIISMNFNTPAIAINYEHKSLGIMQQLNMPELSATINDLIDDKIINKVDYLLDNYEIVKNKIADAVLKEKSLGTLINSEIVKQLEIK